MEHIKLLPRDDFLQIFENEKFIVKETSKHVFDRLHQTPFDPSRAAIKREGCVPAPPPTGNISADAIQLNMTKRLGTLLAIDQATAACTAAKQNGAMSMSATQQLENIARMWNFKGHQTNCVRLAVAEVLSQGYTKTDLAKVIRLQHDDGTFCC